MNRKKSLPRAVFLTAEDMRGGGSETGQLPNAPARGGAADSAAARVTPVPMGPVSNVIDMVMKSASTSDVDTGAHAAGAVIDAKRRRLNAIAIVEHHANMSAIGGVIPLPIMNMAAITAIILRMARSLSKLYGIPFERNRARAAVIGLLGGVMPTGVATIATSALIYAVPGYALLGLAVSSVTASTYARAIGQMLIEQFENGETSLNFPSAIVR